MNSWALALGKWLADYYLLATLLLVVVLLCGRCVKQPARRVVVAWGIVVGLILLAIVCGLPRWPRVSAARLFQDRAQSLPLRADEAREVPLPVLQRTRPEATVNRVEAETAHQRTAAAGEPNVRMVQRIEDPRPNVGGGWQWEQFAAAIAGIFLVGAILNALRTCWGGMQAFLLCRQASDPPARLRRELSRLASGGHRVPRLLVSPRIDNPVALGTFRPTIILPPRSLLEINHAMTRSALAHEWAHIRNGDLWLLAITRCLQSILFAHPIYWWFCRATCEDQELLADAAAARRTTPTGYAEGLLQWARIRTGKTVFPMPAAAGIWERTSNLTRRMAMLLDENQRIEAKASSRWVVGSLAALTSLVVVLSFFTLSPQGLADPPAAGGGAAAESPEVRFNALNFIFGNYPHQVSASYGQFTLRGPIENSLKPMPAGIARVAMDPEDGTLYGLLGHDVVRIDLNDAEAAKVELGLDVPQLSGPCGIAFDTKRRRLLVATLGGKGYLYCYKPDAKKWSVICDLNNVDLAALCYSQEFDTLFGLAQPYGHPQPVLYHFNRKGAVARKVSLSGPKPVGILQHNPRGATGQLIGVGRNLVLIVSPNPHRPKGAEPKTQMFLVDPNSGKVQVAGEDAQVAGKKQTPHVPAPSSEKTTSGNRSVSKGKHEVHVVGIYQGITETDGKIHGPRAFVRVDRPGKLVTLVLTTATPCTWELSLTEGSQVEKVVLGGRGPQAVKGLSEDVPVVEAWRREGEMRLSTAWRLNSVSFRRLVREVSQLVGRPISSFRGEYVSRDGSPLVVDGVQDDARLSAGYPRPVRSLSDLPADAAKLTFQAHHYVPDAERGHHLHASFGSFTLKGPKTSRHTPLPNAVKRMTYDPAGKKYYGISGHGIVEIDLEKQTTTVMDPGLDVPPVSWPCEITFDTKRRRLLLGSSGGGGYIYAYSPESGKWSVLCKRPGALDAFAYCESEDCLYGILFRHGEDGDLYALCKVNPQGAVVRQIPLGAPILPGSLASGPGVCTTQAVPVGNYVVILAAPGDRGQPNGSCIYLVDRKTGEIWLTSKRDIKR